MRQIYKIGYIIRINNRDWRVAEFRMHRGQEWMYTLATEKTDGTFDTMRVNENAMDKLKVEE